MAQETQTAALYQSRGVGWGRRWEGGSKGRGYMYIYDWIILRFDRKQQNSVKQLSSNKKINLKKIYRVESTLTDILKHPLEDLNTKFMKW